MNTSHIHPAFGLSLRKKNKDAYLTEKDVLRYVKPFFFFLAKIKIREIVVYVSMNTTCSISSNYKTFDYFYSKFNHSFYSKFLYKHSQI